MAKQTFILECWCGAPTSIEAQRGQINRDKNCNYDFYRYACKQAKTIERYLVGYVEDAREKGLQWLYPFFFREDGMYQIVITPDGYNREGIIKSGYIKDLINKK